MKRLQDFLIYEKELQSDWISENGNPHLGGDKYDVHINLKNGHNYTYDDIHEIKKYTYDSRKLNNHLYDSHISGLENNNLIDQGFVDGDGNDVIHNVSKLDEALNRHSLEHDLHVYSGVQFHPGELAGKHPSGHIYLPAYTSTTIDKHVATNFAKPINGERHIIHFHLKPGQKGGYVDHISNNSGEHEYIIPRKTMIKIHPEHDEITSNIGHKYHIWHASIVDQEA